MNLPPHLLTLFQSTLPTLFPIQKIILFGSRARGDNGEKSDVDIAVEAKDISAREWADVLEMVERTTLLKVDCVNLSTMVDENFRRNILKEGIVLYERP